MDEKIINSIEPSWTTLIIGYFTIDYQLVKFELRTKLRTSQLFFYT